MVGIDEVGRGSWAGPLLVVAAKQDSCTHAPGTIFPCGAHSAYYNTPPSASQEEIAPGTQVRESCRYSGKLPDGLTDSKLLTRIQREKMFEELIKTCEFGEGWVSTGEIDQDGLANALRLGIARALKALKVINSEQIILDGSINYVSKLFTNASCLVDADRQIPIVSAASVYAKVSRDRFMQELSLKHPNYGFQNHVGYGTKAHQLALKNFGIIDGVHRMSFKPIGAMAGE